MSQDTAAKGSGPGAEGVEGPVEAVLETGHLITVVLEKVQGWIEGAVALLPNLVVAILLVVLFALLSRLVASLVQRGGRRARVQPELLSLMSTVARLATLAVGLFSALSVLQLERAVTSLLAGVGVVGLALGFAFQDIAANFMAGIIMALRRPFHVDDLVETHGVMGHVKRVTLRATVLRNFTGQDVIIPNKDVLQNTIVNYAQSGERRVDVDVGVSYDDDLERAREVAIEAVEGVPERDGSRDVTLVYTGFGASSIDFTVRFWLEDAADFLEGRSHAIMAIRKAFDEAGITIPFPIRTIDLPPREEGDADGSSEGEASAA